MSRVIVEFIHQGSFVKVTAMDEATLTEVSMVGDPNAGEARLKQLIIQKLNYVLEKQGK